MDSEPWPDCLELSAYQSCIQMGPSGAHLRSAERASSSDVCVTPISMGAWGADIIDRSDLSLVGMQM